MAERTFHYQPRSLRHITQDDTTEESLEETLRQSRRVSRIVAPLLSGFHIGIDYGNLSNVRVTETHIVLYVKTPAQKAKLSQLAARIETSVQKAGFTQSLEIRVRPINPCIVLRENSAQGKLRTLTKENALAIEETAKGVTNDRLRDELVKLSKSL